MSQFQSLDEAMTTGAARAVELAAASKVALDYSMASIEIVEQQLARLHSQIPKGFLSRLTKKNTFRPRNPNDVLYFWCIYS